MLRRMSCARASEHFLTLAMMTSIAPTDTSMTIALSAPPADWCPDLELVVPAAPEQSPRTEHFMPVSTGQLICVP